MNDDTPEPTDLAKEIHRNFNRKMRDGGEIDRILNGGQPIEKLEPASDAEIALIKKQIEIQLNEYEEAIGAASAFMDGWKDRQPKGFRRAKTDEGN